MGEEKIWGYRKRVKGIPGKSCRKVEIAKIGRYLGKQRYVGSGEWIRKKREGVRKAAY